MTKSKIVKKEVDSEKQVLSAKELALLDKSYSEKQLKEKDIVIANIKVKLAKTELTLLSANFTLKSKENKELDLELENTRKSLRETNAKHGKILNSIKERLGLPEKFGFNPETGEVIYE